MNADDLTDMILAMRNEVIEDLVETYIPSGTYSEKWNVKALQEEIHHLFNLELPVEEWAKEDGIAEEQILERISDAVTKLENERSERYSPEVMAYFHKAMLLETIDTLWREHLVSLDHLRSAVGFRGYAQRDPLNEYKTESFELFQSMLRNLRRVVTSKLMRFEIIQQPTEPFIIEQSNIDSSVVNDQDNESGSTLWTRSQENRFVDPKNRDPNDFTTWGKVGRNERCPCGSEKKYKHCHGAFV